MDPSVEENVPGLESSKVEYSSVQSKSGIINRVIGFFLMSDEERSQAGIEFGKRPVEIKGKNSNDQEITMEDDVRHSGRIG